MAEFNLTPHERRVLRVAHSVLENLVKSEHLASSVGQNITSLISDAMTLARKDAPNRRIQEAYARYSVFEAVIAGMDRPEQKLVDIWFLSRWAILGRAIGVAMARKNSATELRARLEAAVSCYSAARDRYLKEVSDGRN